MKIKLKEIEFDKDLQPRQKISHKTVESYIEALKGDAKFPPLKIQKVKYIETVKNKKEKKEEENEIIRLICLDGQHRYLAYEEYNKLEEVHDRIYEVEAEYWKEEILDKSENLNLLLLQAASYNKEHGDRLTENDVESTIRRVTENDPDQKLTNELIGRYVGLSDRAVSNYNRDIRAKQTVGRDKLIYRLSLLGRIQEEIAEATELDQSSISKIMKNGNISKIHNPLQEWIEKGKTVEEAALKVEIDVPLAWALILIDEENDLNRMQKFGKGLDNNNDDSYGISKPRLYNVWNWNKRDYRLGESWDGNIPGQLVMNILYYYTKRGDLIVDPLAGGGSTIDACLIMGRKCRAYDKNTTKETELKGVIKRDLIKEGYDSRAKNCDLIFLDPPYWRLKRKEYNEEGTEVESYEGWLSFMKTVANNSFETVKKEGYVSLLLEPYFDRHEEKKFLDLPFTVNQIFLDAGFTEYYRISAPLGPESTAHGMEYGKTNRLILDQNRDLIIYKK